MIGLEQWRASIGLYHSRSCRRLAGTKIVFLTSCLEVPQPPLHRLALRRLVPIAVYLLPYTVLALTLFMGGLVCIAGLAAVKNRFQRSSGAHLVVLGCALAMAVTEGDCGSLERSVRAMAILLIMSGDVEQNPGPLGEQDLRTVSRYLSKLSESDLRTLGMVLGLYQSTVRGYGNVPLADYRYSLLGDWINGKDNVKGCGGATWSSLVSALRDEEVNQTGIADKIEAEQIKESEEIESMVLCPSTFPLHTSQQYQPLPSKVHSQRQSHPTKCSTSCNPPQSPSCQPPPTKCLKLFHQRFPKLCLYTDKLRAIYTQSELPIYSNPACYKWTPSPSKQYIDLLAIDRKEMTPKQVHKYKKAALYGKISSMTTVNGSTKNIKLEEILQVIPGGKLECVLVEGPPGIGKSTLAWQVCYHWGKKDLFQQYSTVLLLPLRDQRVQSAINVEDLFICTNKKLQEQVRNEVTQNDWEGKDTLIILEGLDELPSHLLSQSSIFTVLLSGEALSQATILVTSRPSATEQLHKYWKQRISRHFEIRGFTEENIDKYAQSILSNRDQFSSFKEYVSMHPHIQSMLYVPLHCVITVTVYLQCQQSCTPPPKTLTGLYTCLTQTILSQYLKDNPQYTGENYTLDTVFDLRIPHPVHDYFKGLCKIAFDNLSDQKLVFSDLPKELHDLGFTDAVPELLLYQQSANYSYSFLHLSVQEFLAACHFSFMSLNEQVKTKCYLSRFKNMFRFVAGITKFEGLKVVVRQAIGMHNESEQSGSLNHYSLELLYECQDMSILDTEYTYNVTLSNPSPHLCFALGYCIGNSSCEWQLTLEWVYGDLKAEMILQGLKEGKLDHTKYIIKKIQCVECSIDFIHKLFTQHTPKAFIVNIESLSFGHRPLGSAIPLPPSLPGLIPRMKGLDTLILIGMVMGKSMPDLTSALSRVPTLKNLIWSQMNSENILPLCKWLPTSHLEKLEFVCELSSDSIEMVSLALTTVSSLKILNMLWAKFTIQSMQAIVSLLQQNQSLVEVHLQSCNVHSDGACCLAEALHHNTTLKILNISGNLVCDNRVILEMAEMLKYNTTLEVLDLSGTVYTPIRPSVIRALFKSLAVNQYLKKLIFPSCCMTVHQKKHKPYIFTRK